MSSGTETWEDLSCPVCSGGPECSALKGHDYHLDCLPQGDHFTSNWEPRAVSTGGKEGWRHCRGWKLATGSSVGLCIPAGGVRRCRTTLRFEASLWPREEPRQLNVQEGAAGLRLQAGQGCLPEWDLCQPGPQNQGTCLG